jgi:putative transposase
MIYQFIAVAQSEYPIIRLCKTLGVSTSGYYAWRKRPESQHRREDGELTQAIEKAYKTSRACYGSPRIYAELRSQGYPCSRKRVARLMREGGWCARFKRSRPRTTRQDPAHQKAGNLLKQEFEATVPNQKWVTDVTAVWTQEGWLYLAGVLDLFSRSIVGWAMAAVQDEALVQNALQMALARRHPRPGLLHHSDRGSQYTSIGYQCTLAQAGMVVSMSRTGNCYDNAAMESFWSTLKWECVSRTSFPTRAVAKQAIFEYIECFYQRQRRHSSLGYLSPSQFEEMMSFSTY